MQRAQMVDLAGMVEIMLDHRHNNPARLLGLTPVRHAWARQLGVVQGGDGSTQALVPRTQPGNRGRNIRQRSSSLNERIAPRKCRAREGVVMIHELAAAHMLDDVANGAVSAWRNP